MEFGEVRGVPGLDLDALCSKECEEYRRAGDLREQEVVARGHSRPQVQQYRGCYRGQMRPRTKTKTRGQGSEREGRGVGKEDFYGAG